MRHGVVEGEGGLESGRHVVEVEAEEQHHTTGTGVSRLELEQP